MKMDASMGSNIIKPASAMNSSPLHWSADIGEDVDARWYSRKMNATMVSLMMLEASLAFII